MVVSETNFSYICRKSNGNRTPLAFMRKYTGTLRCNKWFCNEKSEAYGVIVANQCAYVLVCTPFYNLLMVFTKCTNFLTKFVAHPFLYIFHSI